MQPFWESQESVVQASLSSQEIEGKTHPTFGSQVSLVQAFPSKHCPMDPVTQDPLEGSQVEVWQASIGVQGTGVKTHW